MRVAGRARQRQWGPALARMRFRCKPRTVEMQPRILRALEDVYDPCCQEKGISVVDMGLVRSARLEGRHARVELLLTSGWCPFATRVLTEVAERMKRLPEVDSAEVD